MVLFICINGQRYLISYIGDNTPVKDTVIVEKVNNTQNKQPTIFDRNNTQKIEQLSTGYIKVL